MMEEVGFFDLIVWTPLGKCLLYQKYSFLEENQTTNKKMKLERIG
jgi:hypothetical protein